MITKLTTYHKNRGLNYAIIIFFKTNHMPKYLFRFDAAKVEEFKFAFSLFDKDNDYLASWDRDRKINYIRNWKETWSKT